MSHSKTPTSQCTDMSMSSQVTPAKYDSKYFMCSSRRSWLHVKSLLTFFVSSHTWITMSWLFEAPPLLLLPLDVGPAWADCEDDKAIEAVSAFEPSFEGRLLCPESRRPDVEPAPSTPGSAALPLAAVPSAGDVAWGSEMLDIR